MDQVPNTMLLLGFARSCARLAMRITPPLRSVRLFAELIQYGIQQEADAFVILDTTPMELIAC